MRKGLWAVSISTGGNDVETLLIECKSFKDAVDKAHASCHNYGIISARPITFNKVINIGRYDGICDMEVDIRD